MITLRTARRPLVAVAASLAAAAVLAACSSSSNGGSPTTPATTGTGTASGSPSTTAVKVVNVTVTQATGCATDQTALQAGGITFKVENKDATAVSEVELLSGERIVGEKENIPPGFGGSFPATVSAGTYTVYCPGANPETATIKVTGQASGPQNDTIAALLKQATTDYAKYVTTQVGELLTAVKKLDTALHGTSLTAAQTAYMEARPYYEKIEPVAESFVDGKNNLDSDIDARINDVPRSQWTGFHPIEQGLFARKSLKGLDSLGDGLVANVKLLQQKTTGLTYQPTELANGAQSLMDEVATSKITGEEERYSHIDLLDFANNDEGAEQAFAQLEPALTKIDPSLTATVARAFRQLDALVNTYRTGSNPSGFQLYGTLTAADKRKLSAAVKAVAEPLSQVGSKVANV